MKEKICLFLLALLPFLASAQVQIDGVWYGLNNADMTACVTNPYGGGDEAIWDNSNDFYQGDIVIPPSINYNNNVYNVTEISYWAFHGCTGLTSVSIPHSVTAIHSEAFSNCSSLNYMVFKGANPPSLEDGDIGWMGLVYIPRGTIEHYSSAGWNNAFEFMEGDFDPDEDTPVSTDIGTAANPIIIADAQDWATFASNISNSIDADKYYKLADDFEAFSNADNPVTEMISGVFNGHFDGNGKTIYVNILDVGADAAALFSQISGATIENLNVTGTVSSDDFFAAGLVAYCYDDNSILNCHVSTDVDATRINYGGGIVGNSAWGTLTMNGCVYSGQISFNTYAGGLVGENNANLIMNNCLFKGSFSGNGSYHPIATGSGTATLSNVYYLNTIQPTTENHPQGADGIPVSETLIPDDWDIPVIAADNNTYYIQHETPNGGVVKIDGIWYSLNSSDRTAEVTYDVEGYDEMGPTDSYSGNVNIPATINYSGEDYTVTSIGERAFQACSDLTVTIPNTVTSIGSAAFEGCSITEITIPESVTTISNGAFYDCNRLTSVYCYITNTDVINNLGSVFGNCNSPVLYVPAEAIDDYRNSYWAMDFVEIRAIGGDDPNPDDGVVKIDGIWYRLNSSDKTAEVTYDVEGYDEMGPTDSYSGNVNIPATINYSGEDYTVTSIGERAFQACSDLTVTIPNTVTSIGSAAFEGCSITEITIPESVTTISNGAFYDCNRLTSVYCYITNTDVINNLGSIFGNCNSPVLYVPAEAIDDYRNSYWAMDFVEIRAIEGDDPNPSDGVVKIDGIWYRLNSSDKTAKVTYDEGCDPNMGPPASYSGNVNIPSTVNYSGEDYTVTSIGEDAFNMCSNLTSVTIPNSVTSIDNWAFGYCGLTSVTIPNSVTSIGECAFDGCSNLTSITIPNSVASIGKCAFEFCGGLTSVYCNITDANVINSYDSYFSNCNSPVLYVSSEVLETYRNSGWGMSGELSDIRALSHKIDGIWFSLNSTDKTAEVTYDVEGYDPSMGPTNSYSGNVNIPATVNYSGEDYTVTSIGERAFQACSDLTVTIPNTVTSIGPAAFESSNLTEITIPESVTNIGNGAFSMCGNLTSVSIGNSVTTIGNSAFDMCGSLTSVTIPSSVIYIGGCAFLNCNSLTSVYCNITDANVINSYDSYFSFCNSPVLFVSSEVLDTYRNSGWGMSGDFSNITVIRAPLAGSGTASDPFVIENAQDWSIFAGNVSDGIDADKYYKLSDNFNNADSPITDIVGVDGYPFRGHFDGNNKTLSVNINGQAPFCRIEGATIENLNVTGTVNCGEFHAAGLVGFSNGSDNYILNCHVATNVDCPGYAGGIVGHGGSSTLTMNGCVYSGQISGFDVCAGGLMGWSDSMTLYMNNCLFKGSFNGSGSYHPVALSCGGESSSVVANVYYIHTAAPTIDYYLIPGADGIPVSETLIADIWEEPVVAADGKTYYMPSNEIIEFADPEVKRVCLERWAQWDTNGDGEFSRYEASLVADDMSYMFYYKESITSFDELKYFTGIKSIGDDAFDGCSSLTSVDLSNCTSIGSYAFNNCTNLASVDLSNCTSIGSYAFCGTNLASVDLSNCTSIGDWAFGCCGELASVALSNCTNIGNAAFNGCSSLTSVDLSNCTSIGSDAFNGCSSLTSVGDLSNCSYLGAGCFKDSGIDIITLPGNTVATLGSSNDWGDALVFVPVSLLNAYQNSDNWKDIKNKIFAIGSQTEYDLAVTAQSNKSQLTKTIGEDKLGSVVSLKLSGTINSYDIMVMRNKMPNLQHLDLTDVSIVANNYEYYTGYHSENDVLGPYCFHEVSNLRTVKLPKTIKSIGDNAFSSSGVREVVIPGDVLETIGYMTFANCNNLQKVTLSGNLLREISAEVFWCCYNLQYVDIPEGVEQIGANAFYGCSSLQNVTLPSSLRDIDSSAFQYTGLTSVKLPARLNSIGDGAFSYCGNLTELHIPSMMTRIGDYAFDGCDNLLDIWTHHLVPQNIDQHTFSTYQTATLHIIKTSYDDYYWNTQWSQFLDLVEFAYEDLDSEYDMYKQVWLINNNTDFTVDDDKGVIDNTQDSYGQIGEGSALICENESENQTVGTIELDVNDEAAATLIENGNLTVDQMQFNIAVNGGQWYFFSFPFRISLDNISCEGEWLFRYYDSDARARGESGWQDLPAGTEWLEPGMGYIFQSNEGGTLIVTVNQADVKLGGLDVNLKLTIYSGQSAENSSWNFLGNPYTSYFNVGNTGYDCPVTVWNGYEYVTVEPGSDYYLRPFQAYFVQKPEDITEISFSADNRETYNQTQASAGAKPMLLKKASESQTTSIPLATTSRHQMSIQRVNAMSSTFNPVNPPEPMSTQTNVDMERGITTAVNSIDTEENDKTIYNTSGQRINKVQRGGVNIIRDQSGKTRKVLVK